MELIVDIGNSYIKCGVFNDDKLLRFYSFKTNRKVCFAKLKKEQINHIAISSVVPYLTAIVINKLKAIFKAPICDIDLIKNNLKILPIIKKKNSHIGGDLIADLIAVKKIYGAPAIVFDIGTASKVLVLNKDAVFIGASFFPGLNMSTRAMFNETSNLPEVDLTNSCDLIGVDTVTCIRSGIVNSIKYTIDGFVNDYKKILGKDAKVIITGGGAIHINHLLRDYIYNQYLTLYGVYFILKGAMNEF